MSAVVAAMLVGMLLVIGLSMSSSVQTEAALLRVEIERTHMLAAAMSGVQASLAVLDYWGQNGWDSLDEGWSDSGWLEQQPVGEMAFSVGFREGYEGEALRSGVTDENRRVPFDLLRPEVIERIPQLSAAGKAHVRLVVARQGVRIPWLLDSQLDAKDRMLLDWLVSEFDSGHANINTVSAEVLVALGVPWSGAKKVIAFRAGPDAKQGTNDDRPFRDLTNPQEAFRACKLEGHEASSLTYLVGSGAVGVNSTHFRIRSRGFRPELGPFCEVSAVVARNRAGQLTLIRKLHHWGPQ